MRSLSWARRGLCAILLVLTLSGCGGGDNSTNARDAQIEYVATAFNNMLMLNSVQFTSESRLEWLYRDEDWASIYEIRSSGSMIAVDSEIKRATLSTETNRFDTRNTDEPSDNLIFRIIDIEGERYGYIATGDRLADPASPENYFNVDDPETDPLTAHLLRQYDLDDSFFWYLRIPITADSVVGIQERSAELLPDGTPARVFEIMLSPRILLEIGYYNYLEQFVDEADIEQQRADLEARIDDQTINLTIWIGEADQWVYRIDYTSISDADEVGTAVEDSTDLRVQTYTDTTIYSDHNAPLEIEAPDA